MTAFDRIGNSFLKTHYFMPPKKESTSNFLGKLPLWLILLACIAVGITIAVLIIDILVSTADKEYGERLGIFGDFFGGLLNPIVSIIGFIAVLYTINSQRLDAEEQQKATALANKTQIKQQFEETFTNLINFLNNEFSTVRHIPIKITYGTYPHQEIPIFTDLSRLYIKSLSSSTYAIEYLNYHSTFGRMIFNKYFKILEQLLKLIDSLHYPTLDKETTIDKEFYTNILLINLNDELIFLFALEFVFKKNNITCREVKFGNLESLELIKKLGLLRNLEFSPFNKQSFETNSNFTLSYTQHPLTLALVETFGEQAFKSIDSSHAFD